MPERSLDVVVVEPIEDDAEGCVLVPHGPETEGDHIAHHQVAEL